VVAGSLQLKGVLKPAWFYPSKKSLSWLSNNDENLEDIKIFHSAEYKQASLAQRLADTKSNYYKGIYAAHDEMGDWPPMLVFCLPIIAWANIITAGLLLVVSDKESFKRVGLFRSAPTRNFDHLPQLEITII
jgi:hypothetical protein